MKNGIFKKILSLTLVVLMILSAVLATGCAKKSKKKDRDKDGNEITIEEIKEKAEEAGYQVEYERLEEADEVGTVAILEILDTNSEEYVYAQVTEYKDTDSATTAFNKTQMIMEQIGDLAEGFEAKKSGKLIIFGSAEILEKVW